MSEKKVEAFAAHILQECEQEGFTVSEVARLPEAIEKCLGEQLEKLRFRAQHCGKQH